MHPKCSPENEERSSNKAMPFEKLKSPHFSGEAILEPATNRQKSRAISWADCVIDPTLARGSRCAGLGLRFRTALAGPEQVLVDDFLRVARIQLKPHRGLTVFMQPALETGFPDIVAVIWRKNVAKNWLSERGRLRAADLRLLHLLASRGSFDYRFLRSVFQKGLSGMLTRLEEAGVATIGKSKCWARNRSKIFAVEHIISIEAKIAASSRVLEQARANSWFSSESYALLPSLRAGLLLKDAASALGVGIISLDYEQATAKQCDASVREVPLSYGSWLFNEWTWQIAREQGAI